MTDSQVKIKFFETEIKNALEQLEEFYRLQKKALLALGETAKLLEEKD